MLSHSRQPVKPPRPSQGVTVARPLAVRYVTAQLDSHEGHRDYVGSIDSPRGI